MVGLAAVAIAAAFASGLKLNRSSRRERAPRAATSWTPTPPTPPPTVVIPPIVPDQKEIQDQVRKATRRSGRIGIIVGMQALERGGKPDRAEAILRKQRDPIAHLELFLLQRREGKQEEATVELRKYIASRDDDDWPTPLLRVFAGQAKDEDAMKAAADDPDDLCEANYYLGILHRSRDLLEKAASPECDESDRAQEQLKMIQPGH
jgi:hypothetical protein